MVNSRALADRYWEELLEINPLLATQVGDERFDDRLPDPSPDGIERRRDVHRRALAEAKRLRPLARDVTDRAVCDTVEAFAGPELAGIELQVHRFAPIDQLWGPGTLLDQFASLQRADTPSRVDRYLDRLRALQRYLDDCSRLLLDDTNAPVAPRLIVDRCIRQVERIIETPPEHSPAVRLIPAGTQARERAAKVLRESTLPAYSGYLEALKSYRRRGRETIGVGDLPEGDATYRVFVQRWTSLSLDPKEVHELGTSQLREIDAERLHLANTLGASDPATAIATYTAVPENRFQSPDDILQTARHQVQLGWERAHQYFGRLPRQNCQVLPVPPDREADVLEHYLAGTSDGSRPGVYYVNTARAQSRQRRSLATTTFHEANPGHHLQASLEQEQADRPDLLRFGGELAGGAFVEGWGLYSERLADEMGLFRDDYERLSMLELQALRAARLVVDTGIHALGWRRDQVIDLLMATGLDRDRAELETDRYIALPGQALSYKIGQNQIEESRRIEERRLGAAFSLRDFHDRLLFLGSLPLSTLRRELST